MKNQPTLSSHDRELLEQIQSLFDAAEQLIGCDPMTWYRFQLTSERKPDFSHDLVDSRLKAFNGTNIRETRDEQRS